MTDVTDDVVEGAEVQTQDGEVAEEQTASSRRSRSTPPGGSTQYGNQAITDQNLQGQQSSRTRRAQGKGRASKQKSSEEREQAMRRRCDRVLRLCWRRWGVAGAQTPSPPLPPQNAAGAESRADAAHGAAGA